MEPIDLDRMLEHLERVRRTHSGATARCPAHDDRTPSLSINVVDGKILWKGHAGCSQDEVTDALRDRGAIPARKNPADPAAYARYKLARRLRHRERRHTTAPTRDSDSLPNRIWQAGRPMTTGPGAKYHNDRGVHTRPPHEDVRWIPRNTARAVAWRPTTGIVREMRHGCRPEIPSGQDIAGIIVYRFRAETDPPDAAAACQIEAIRNNGSRALFLGDRKVKRPSVANSDFADGARVFRARPGEPGAGLYICEGPLDALALTKLSDQQRVKLHSAAVIGVAGTGGVTIRNLGSIHGPIRVSVDNDEAGDAAIERMIEELTVHGMAGRRRNHRPPSPYNDWCDYLIEILVKTAPNPRPGDQDIPERSRERGRDKTEKT